MPIDRPRLRDRLRELWLAPWAEAHGEGALLRLTVARAALQRLVTATPEFADVPSPDLLVVAGGVWAVAPTPAVAVAVARRGPSHWREPARLDHARLLGPLGTIADEGERAAVLADLVDDAPRAARDRDRAAGAARPDGSSAGRSSTALAERRPPSTSLSPAGSSRSTCHPVSVVRPSWTSGTPSRSARAAGRSPSTSQAEWAECCVDLRDVPLRLPDRLDRRRELLAAWQQPIWSPLEA